MRVGITITRNMWQSAAVRRAAECAFGDDIWPYSDRLFNGKLDGIKLIVTPAQLVGFQVARETLGGQNLWKEMKVTILDPKPCPNRRFPIIDVRPPCGR